MTEEKLPISKVKKKYDKEFEHNLQLEKWRIHYKKYCYKYRTRDRKAYNEYFRQYRLAHKEQHKACMDRWKAQNLTKHDVNFILSSADIPLCLDTSISIDNLIKTVEIFGYTIDDLKRSKYFCTKYNTYQKFLEDNAKTSGK